MQIFCNSVFDDEPKPDQDYTLMILDLVTKVLVIRETPPTAMNLDSNLDMSEDHFSVIEEI